MQMEIRHLRNFTDALKRDVLTDALARPTQIPDKELLMRVITYGNTFLEGYKETADKEGCIVWFDVHFGEPAQVGMSWAYNPHAPFDDLYGVGEFWRMWSEDNGLADNKTVYTLHQCQWDMADYQMQHLAQAE